jgi:serpin B
MDVNEEGTEAAAATAVIMGATMALPREAPPIEFRVDRPFVLALVDNDSKEILFLGSILKP